MVFKFSIGGYFGPSFLVEWKDGELLCKTSYLSHFENAEPTEVFIWVKDDPQWKDVLDYLATRIWKEVYFEEVMDGTGWELEVFSNTINIKSHGSNAYPPGFKTFLKLLNKVLSKEDIVVYWKW